MLRVKGLNHGKSRTTNEQEPASSCPTIQDRETDHHPEMQLHMVIDISLVARKNSVWKFGIDRDINCMTHDLERQK